jgi:hypothetical protein
MHLVVICPHLEVHSAKWQLDWKAYCLIVPLSTLSANKCFWKRPPFEEVAHCVIFGADANEVIELRERNGQEPHISQAGVCKGRDL